MSIKIVKAELSDVNRLRELRLQALADAPYAFGSDHKIESEKPTDYWESYITKTNWCFALADGQDIGLLAVDIADEDRGSDCWLSSWWLADSFRGKGVPKLMLDWLDDLCISKGWQKQGLGVWPENERAIAAYLKLGFVRGEKPLQSRSRPDKMYLPMYRNLPL